jgi:lysophospholipase L1-like esterase
MGYPMAAWILMPLLAAQGFYVRRVTPRLPEPPGDRGGVCGRGPRMRLLITGDSAAAGVGAKSQCQALSGRLIALLSVRFKVSWKLSAEIGSTVKDVVARLEAREPESFDVIVTSAGVNDATRGTPIRHWLAWHDRLIALSATKFGCGHLLVSSLPPVHLFPALPQPLRWCLGRQAGRLNAALKQHLDGRDDCLVVTPAYPSEPDFIAPDGFHPSPLAYAFWARHIAEVIFNRYGEKNLRALESRIAAFTGSDDGEKRRAFR